MENMMNRYEAIFNVGDENERAGWEVVEWLDAVDGVHRGVILATFYTASGELRALEMAEDLNIEYEYYINEDYYRGRYETGVDVY